MYFTLLKVQKFFEAVYQSFISLLRVLLRFHFRSGFKRTAADGSSIFVLANGPSLRKDLDKFGKELSASSTMGGVGGETFSLSLLCATESDTLDDAVVDA